MREAFHALTVRGRGFLAGGLTAAHRVDGVAELTEPFDVSPQGALGDLEPLGELAPGPEPVGLQERQQP
jgi:hypothetical protein